MNAISTSGPARTLSLLPTNFQEAMRFAELAASSDLVPKDFRGKPANVLIAMQMGGEIGLSPLQAIQGIAVVNGRPTVWDDAALALARAHPECESISEGVEGEGDARQGFCEVKRRGENMQRRTFSVADAKRAKLWDDRPKVERRRRDGQGTYTADNDSPWFCYPDRMLQLRARGFAIRDVFADALKGLITAEEARDIPAQSLPPAKGPTMDHVPQPMGEPLGDAGTREDWPRLTADSQLVNARDEREWLRGVQGTVGRLESSAAVNAWRQEMGPLFGSISERSGGAVRLAEEIISERLDQLAVQGEDA